MDRGRDVRDEVAGTSGGTYAAITGADPTTAVILAADDDESETARLGGQFGARSP